MSCPGRESGYCERQTSDRQPDGSERFTMTLLTRLRTSRAPRCAAALLAALLALSAGAAAQTYRVKMEFDARVRMPDGIALSADVYRPDAPGKFPVILVRTPYDNGTAPNVRRGKFWASRGYVYIVQDVRGRG